MARKKTNNDILINVLLDRSGSMGHLAKEVIGHYNAYIEEQKKEKGKTLVSLVLFDDEYEEIYIGKDVQEIEPLTDKTYYVRGMTAYLDAIGKFINSVDGIKDKPEKIIFMVNTDGLENASHEYGWAQVKELVKDRTDKGKWQFIFVTAGLDKATVERVTVNTGFDPNNVLVAAASPAGSWGTYNNFSGYTRAYRGAASGQSVTIADTANTDEDVQTLVTKTVKKKKVTTTK